MSGQLNQHPDLNSSPHFVEVDPTGRYGRYNDVLGKGSSKTVYRAFDEYNGIEVAWNQVKANDFLQSSQDLERLYSEIHLLKTLKNSYIIKMHASWIDTSTGNINFITEMFTSGTLRQYMQKHRKVNIRVVKHWCRQILRGLHYLHSHDPPVIHRDLKCDNILINGNHGDVKIGDFGLAAVLRNSFADHCVGTPEFMAPEVYNEEYNELVDIYSFGMCVLEMVTLEFPYSECTVPAQIYKKVTSGKKPDAFYKVENPEVRNFVEKCLATMSLRLSARELLEDSFLKIEEDHSNLMLAGCQNGIDGICLTLQNSFAESHFTDVFSGFDGNQVGNASEGENMEIKPNGIEFYEQEEDENTHINRADISMKGQRSEDGGIFMRIRIVQGSERARNIYFSFDVEKDTALSVATEMVSELELADHDEVSIAKMIDGEIAALMPEWRFRASMEDDPCFTTVEDSLNWISNYMSNGYQRLHIRNDSSCTVSTHGRFEEIVYNLDNGSEQEITDNAPSVEFSSSGHRENRSDNEHEDLNTSNLVVDTKEIIMEKDDGESRDEICHAPYHYENGKDKVNGQARERKSFPQVGSFKTQGYEQTGATSKRLQATFSFSCLPRTSSVQVDVDDAWSFYFDFLHTSF